jgi:hypothetical protein
MDQEQRNRLLQMMLHKQLEQLSKPKGRGRTIRSNQLEIDQTNTIELEYEHELASLLRSIGDEHKFVPTITLLSQLLVPFAHWAFACIGSYIRRAAVAPSQKLDVNVVLAAFAEKPYVHSQINWIVRFIKYARQHSLSECSELTDDRLSKSKNAEIDADAEVELEEDLTQIEHHNAQLFDANSNAEMESRKLRLSQLRDQLTVNLNPEQYDDYAKCARISFVNALSSENSFENWVQRKAIATKYQWKLKRTSLRVVGNLLYFFIQDLLIPIAESAPTRQITPEDILSQLHTLVSKYS